MNEIETAIKQCEISRAGRHHNSLRYKGMETALQALRSQLAREQNEPLTCEGCIHDGYIKSGRYLLG